MMQMKRMKTLSIITFLIVTQFITAQTKEFDYWQFGFESGIHFENDTVIPITSSIHSTESCASISDKNGNLLFYTDGVTVWNKTNSVMMNGTNLLGLTSSTQGALIVRKPGSTNLYYLFTADGTSNALNHHMENGYRYSIIDMNLDNGLGAVTVVKNELLYAPSTERLAAVKQTDGVNFWIMTHEWNSSKFRAYSLTCEGLDTNAVVSDIGLKCEPYDAGASISYLNAIGQMKFSPDGHRLAMVNQGKLKVELYTFDNSTGILSNRKEILAYWADQFLQPSGEPFDFEYVYGVEFSPNGNRLYVSSIQAGNMFQYDITKSTSSEISATGYKIPPDAWCTEMGPGSYSCPGSFAGMQLGTDGKIYCAVTNYWGETVGSTTMLYAFMNPHANGPELQLKKIVELSNPVIYGLPTCEASKLNPNEIKIDLSNCYTAHFQSSYPSAQSTQWHVQVEENSWLDTNCTQFQYTYSDIGTFQVILVLENQYGCTDTIFKTLSIQVCPPDSPDPLPLLVFPNVISPNNDGVNDAFLIKGISNYEANRMTILNRWGNVVFETQNYSESNVFNGVNCSDGVYFYRFIDEKLGKTYNGNVTIIR